ncbi:SusD/RagB family nutrient-binding outer membrane lipoprotein [Namhaeicola litoreus]|uniref:SusD/RagB family nutrient-binding outer membrane lipoprotein n=1 Tax=Namhaeicola litoreus TaxID=1052145 RepID=A0ABW3Y894_9FLAO
MKKLKNYILLFSTGLAMLSCSSYTDGINVDPNNFTEAPGNLLVGQAELEVVKLTSSNASRLSGIFTDQFTGSDRQYETINNYTVTAGDFDDEWDDVYVQGAAQAILAKEAGLESGDDLLVGVASIMEALLMGESAALWGDIPYSAAFDVVDNPNPTYDSQAEVFADVQALLSDAASRLGTAKVANVYNSAFVSNGAVWAQIAHSLKARYYLIAKDYTNALEQAKLGISSANGDLLSLHSTVNGSENLYWQFEEEQRGGYLTANGSNLVKLLSGERARLLATPGDAARLNDYFVATPAGHSLNTDSYFGVDAPYPIVSFVETKLIEAEAAARTSGDGLTPFNEVRAYLAEKYNGSFPASTASGDALINQILEEKYCSMPGSIQIFNDVRRTKNVLGVPVKNTTAPSIPQRFLYPQIEINSNASFPGLIDLFEPTPVNK